MEPDDAASGIAGVGEVGGVGAGCWGKGPTGSASGPAKETTSKP